MSFRQIVLWDQHLDSRQLPTQPSSNPALTLTNFLLRKNVGLATRGRRAISQNIILRNRPSAASKQLDAAFPLFFFCPWTNYKQRKKQKVKGERES